MAVIPTGEERRMALIAVLAAVLVAAHSPFQSSLPAVLGGYAYWLCRIGAEAMLFFAIRAVIDGYSAGRFSVWALAGTAIVVSHPLFVLTVTAVDLVLGFPEIGIASGSAGQTHIAATLREMFYLADNHIALCLLLSLPRLMVDRAAGSELAADTFLSTLDPPLAGPILWIEAQEHYVRLTTARESRLVLARFSDVVRELPDTAGMQVHRSHWVSAEAVERAEKEGQSLYLHLVTGTRVPVSRSFRQRVLERLT